MENFDRGFVTVNQEKGVWLYEHFSKYDFIGYNESESDPTSCN